MTPIFRVPMWFGLHCCGIFGIRWFWRLLPMILMSQAYTMGAQSQLIPSELTVLKKQIQQIVFKASANFPKPISLPIFQTTGLPAKNINSDGVSQCEHIHKTHTPPTLVVCWEVVFRWGPPRASIGSNRCNAIRTSPTSGDELLRGWWCGGGGWW